MKLLEINLRSIIAFIAALSLVGVATSCKQPKKTAAKPPSAAQNTNDNDPDNQNESPYPQNTSDANPKLKIEPTDGSSRVFKFDLNETVQISFKVSGASSDDDVIIGLSELPDGMTLSGTNLRPIVKLSRVTRTVRFKFLLRDANACEKKESSSSDCRISTSDFGDIDSNSSYDTTSDTYTIEVGDTNTTTTNNNNEMIQMITTLMPTLAPMLPGLDTATLTQILNMANGGGMNPAIIINMLGLGLVESENTIPRPILEEMLRIAQEKK